MKKARIAFGAFCVFACLAWLGIRFWPTNEKIVELRLRDLAETLSFREIEGVVQQTIWWHKILAFFSSDVSVDPRGVYFDSRFAARWEIINGRGDLELSLRWIPKNLRRLEVEFVDVLVKVSPDVDSATAFASALVGGWWKDGRQSEISIAQELKFELKRTGRDWEITRVVTYRTLQ